MALGDLMASRYSQSSVVHLDECSSSHEDGDLFSQRRDSETASSSHGNATASTTTSMAYLHQNKVLGEPRHEAFEGCLPTGPSDSGLVSKWRPKDRVSSVSLAAPFFFVIVDVDSVAENGPIIHFNYDNMIQTKTFIWGI
jgi:regulator-associated protein of mTOR